ncbi:S41 family peptidase [Emticicia soli]|uniref:S41 family peptidase n=1 Tax=Emticicia soli TaxID=2027878 RepID=A0ABW5J3N3_9BACT
MKRLLSIFFLIYIAIFSPSCQKDAEPTLNTEVQNYLNEMLYIMQTNSINRRSINWSFFKKNVLDYAKGAQNINDDKTIGAIQMAIDLLNDSHSFYMTSKNTYIVGRTAGATACLDELPNMPELDNSIGYVKVGAFSGNATEALAYVQAIQTSIKNSDNDAIKGWIVDLRGNFGGNMWPMLCGIGPILGDGVAGHFIDADEKIQPWGYINGVTGGFQIENPYILKKNNPKVAVLVDGATASSGEAVAIAFKNRPDAKLFGRPTCGVSTANRSFVLSDNATLYLTVSTMADRTQKAYGKKVEPDVNIVSQQQYISQAIDWLKQ